MALSGSSSTIFSNNNMFRLRIQWTATQNLAGNYSDVTAQLYLDSISTYGVVSDGTSSATTITINGDTTTFYATSTLTANQNKLLGTHTVRVYHETDGSKQIQVAASHNFDLTWNGSWVGMVYTESWPWLDLLQRASTVWLSNPSTGLPVTTMDYGQPVRINITAADATFKHTIGLYWHDWSSYPMDKGMPRTYDWTVLPALMDYIPNGTASWGTIAVDTWTTDNVFVGGTQIRLDTTVPASAKPSLTSITMSEQNATVFALMGAGFYVQNASVPRATINGAAAQYSAGIAAYEFIFEGKTYINYGNTKDLDNPLTSGAAKTISCRVKDSRGLWSSTVSVNINVLAYAAPALTTFTAARTNNTNSTLIDVVRNGTSATLNNGTINKNSVTIKIEYRATGGTTYTQGYITTFAGGSFGATSNIGSAFAVGTSYDVLITVTDSLSLAVTARTVVGAIVKPFSIGPTGIGAGKIWTQGGLDAAGGAFIDGGLTLTGSTAGNVPRSAYANGYHGLILPDGTDANWLRTPTTGLLPAASGGASSSLGTSTWPFNNIYGKTVYQDGSKIVDEGTIANSGINWDRNYIKFANGSMVVWGNTYVAGVAFSNGPAGLYWSSSGITATFGVTFTALHSVVGTGSACFIQHAGTSTTSVTYNCYRMWNDTVTVGAQWIAWGRWK